MAEIHVVPGSSESQLISQYYFYSDYNPAEHFTYNRVFKEDGITEDIDPLTGTPENERKAFAKVLEYHLSFEQVLPKENNNYIEFYRPLYSNNEFSDYLNIAEKDYVNIEEDDLLPKLEKLPIKSQLTGLIKIDRQMDEEYSKMDLSELIALYNNLNTQQMSVIYSDATRRNIHTYNCALYCRIERPIRVFCENGGKIIKQAVDSNNNPLWYPDSTTAIKYTDKNGNILVKNGQYPVICYINAFDFRKNLRLINSTLGTKIPVEEGWYRYDKLDKKWKYICEINPTLILTEDFEYTS